MKSIKKSPQLEILHLELRDRLEVIEDRQDTLAVTNMMKIIKDSSLMTMRRPLES